MDVNLKLSKVRISYPFCNAACLDVINVLLRLKHCLSDIADSFYLLGNEKSYLGEDSVDVSN